MVQRISGLASGMDIDSIVKSLMTAERMPIDKLAQKRIFTEWQRQDYLDLNTKMYDFRNNKLYNFKLEGTLTAKAATPSGDTTVATARPLGDAQAGNLSIKVKSLATAATNSSTAAVTADAAFDPSKKLNQLNFTNAFTDNNIVINNKVLTFDPAVDTLNSVISKINKETNVTAFFDTTTKKLSLVSKQTGQVNGMSGTGDKITFSGSLLTDSMNLAAGSPQERAATDAELFINDMATTRTSNKFLVNGVEITLNKVSASTGTDPADPATYTATTFGVANDTDKILNSIKSFITDYNDMLKTLQDKVDAKRYRDFQPLTDEQKTDMKENDIELWNEKAKSGTLRNDSILMKTITGMRSAVMAQVDNGSTTYNSLSSIGIGSVSYQDNGKLSIKDEKKLREAIEADPTAVMNLFTANGNGDADQSDVGIAERLYDTMAATMKSVTKKAGTSALLSDSSVLGQQMKRLNQQISDGNSRLIDVENRYYKRFTAMEQAISRYNAQSGQLSGFMTQ